MTSKKRKQLNSRKIKKKDTALSKSIKWLNWLFFSDIFKVGNVTPKNMQDSRKIRQKLERLNSGIPEKDWKWVEAPGNHALTKVEGDFRGGKVTFFPASGMPLKVFINKITGEIRIFPALIFERDNN